MIEKNIILSRNALFDDQAVKNMFTAYFYELAAWDPGIAMNEAGLPVWTEFEPPGPNTLDECSLYNWWIRDQCIRYAIRSGNAAIGFAIVLEDKELLPDGIVFKIVDFYIAPKARKTGVGWRAAQLILEKHHGLGQLFVLKENHLAQRFWRAVLKQNATNITENESATEFRFSC